MSANSIWSVKIQNLKTKFKKELTKNRIFKLRI